MKRQLNTYDLAAARRLEASTLRTVADPIITSLLAIPIAGGRTDPAGIAIRGESVFNNFFDRSHYYVSELAAAHVWLWDHNCQLVLIEALEVAFGEEG